MSCCACSLNYDECYHSFLQPIPLHPLARLTNRWISRVTSIGGRLELEQAARKGVAKERHGRIHERLVDVQPRAALAAPSTVLLYQDFVPCTLLYKA